MQLSQAVRTGTRSGAKRHIATPAGREPAGVGTRLLCRFSLTILVHLPAEGGRDSQSFGTRLAYAKWRTRRKEDAAMNYAMQMIFALLLAIPVASIVWTFTQEEVFKEVRDSLKAYQKRHADSFWRQKLAYLPTCPYCLSHYVAAVFIAVFNFHMLADDWRGYVVSLFTLVLVTNLYVSLYNLVRVALRRQKALADKAEAELRYVLQTPPAERARPRLRAIGGARREGKRKYVEA
jgi:hypothetical protein